MIFHRSVKYDRKSEELAIQNQILQWMKYFPSKGFGFPVDNRAQWDAKLRIYRKYTIHHMSGVSDICGQWCLRGLYIEVKAPDGVVSTEQKFFLSLARAHGGIGFVARSLDDAEKELKKYSMPIEFKPEKLVLEP